MPSAEHPHERRLRDQINAISPGACEDLERLPTSGSEIARRILGVILEFACKAQHVGSIEAGRKAFGRLPKDWLSDHLRTVVDRALNLADEWEYRRFMELLNQAGNEHKKYYLAIGLKSLNPEVQEAAQDFSASCAT